MNFSIDQCQSYSDNRGKLVQFINEQFLVQNNLRFGQVYLLTFDGRNIIRGNHYHEKTSETFCLVQGEVEIVLEDIISKEHFSQIFRSNDGVTLRISIGPKIAHAIRSISDNAVLISYASRVYDPLDEDKYIYHLI